MFSQIIALLQYPTVPISDALAAFFAAAYYPYGFAELVRQFYSLLYGYP